ncbi:hypothetical protein O7632_11335 [Solwaraspora sp. WMMD406]|uniref:hypothetical protein n=1 Tax=Solwaraspora sp. WMMD406 TaxID=3016095 RepID=UPI002416A3F0|nr:hypothetical protein [Solwaraspora sp. WMMD406]MDG4764690.1 hypothetical protein [Solwaraspora sp. WMMD406]
MPTSDGSSPGREPAPRAGSTHLAGQIGTPHTVVRAGEHTVKALLAGIAAGHSWIAGSTDVDLSLTVSTSDRSADTGERLDTGGATATVRVEVRHPDGRLAALTNPVTLI